MRFWNKSLMARLVTYFLALSVIGVIATMLITLAIVRSSLTSSIYDRLDAVATLKEDEINRWVNDQRDELSYLAVAPDLRVNVRTLSAAEEDPAKYAAAHDTILEILAGEAASQPSFSEVFLMSSVGGKVLVSTEKGNEGQYRVSDSYYTQGRLDYYIQNVYTSPQTGQPAMTISAPVRDAGGNLLGVLAIHINLERLDSIILQRAGLGETGETYMVDRFNNFISVARSGEREFPRGVHTQGIDAALRGVNGSAMYTNYNDIPVIGVYRWVDERETALLAEINQSEALAPVQRVAALIIISGLAIVVILTLGIFRLARQIAHPLLAINNAADQMATGDLEAHAPVLTEDEIGTLAAAFNTMARQIKQLVSGLEQRVAERTTALSTVAEISTAASTIMETNKLLQEVVELSKKRFGLYHAHIYLLNEAGDTLVLASGAGEPGRQMMAKGLSIPLEREQSLVARAARERKGITVNDVTQAPDFLPNPLLPDTRSELAVPMIIGENVIGVFDVQSDTVGRFTEADINVQTTLASQIASAVQNARLYAQADTSRQEAQSLVDYASEAILVVDLETGNFTEPNESAEKLYGLPHEELVKVGPAQMSPPKQPDGRDSTEKAMEKIGDAMQGKSPIFEWMHRNAQGQDILCEVRLVRLPGAHPRVRATVTDITERKHLEELNIQRARQLAAVAEISTISSRELDIDKMLHSVAHLTQRQFGLYHAHVFVHNENTAELKIAACGYKEGDEREGTDGTAVIPLAQEQSLVARSARTRQAVIVNDVANEPGWLPNPFLPDTASEMAVPLIIGDQILGVLDVQSENLNAFSGEDANIYATLASQVSTALQNARSFAKSQQQAERESTLNLISQKIQSATTVEAVLQIAARELGHALGAPMTIAQLSMKDKK